MIETTALVRLHVRFDGRSEDMDLADLGLPANAGDAELRAALARRYERAPADLDEYVVTREPQAIIVRPIAYYG
jgi:hypothetical protein